MLQKGTNINAGTATTDIPGVSATLPSRPVGTSLQLYPKAKDTCLANIHFDGFVLWLDFHRTFRCVFKTPHEVILKQETGN